MTCFRAIISGIVQGVGYRYWLRGEAERLGVDGWCRNRNDGTVEALFEGDGDAVDRLIALCRQGPPGANVRSVEVVVADPEGTPGFRILASLG